MAKNKEREEFNDPPVHPVAPAVHLDASRPIVAAAKFTVSLKHQPTLEIDAGDEAEAICKYNAACGITQTDHPHAVTQSVE